MNIGFIGAGNMTTAIIKGIIDGNLNNLNNIYVNSRTESDVSALKELYKIIDGTKKEIIEKSDIVILAVKPNQISKVIDEIKNIDDNNTVYVSIAAGLTIKNIEELFEKNVKLVRCMPNTPVTVRQGMTGLCGNNLINDEDMKKVVNIFNTIGKTEIVSENQMDAVVAVSGSSPAYVYMMIEAMADGAVAEGLTREKAYIFAAQAVLGSAKMVLESGLHPGDLKDRVCSPGGTTIEAVKVLEEKGFRASIMEAMEACANKSRDMKK